MSIEEQMIDRIDKQEDDFGRCPECGCMMVSHTSDDGEITYNKCTNDECPTNGSKQ